MRWDPLEANLLATLESYRADLGRLIVVAPPSCSTLASVAELLVREGRAFHALELEICYRRLATLAADVRSLRGGEEYDRSGVSGPHSLPGHQEMLDRLANAEYSVRVHCEALARLWGTDALAHASEILARFEFHPRTELAALKASPDQGRIVELFDDGYALEPALEAQIVARRTYLGLPSAKSQLS